MEKKIDLNTPLSIDQIDFRVQSINKGKYATILAYKDARADMNRLDEVVGVLNWKREHTRDNRNCIVSVWCDGKKQWISKEDTGSESSAEANKGLASDSFKRACFNLGIGRELYDYPLISIKLKDNEVSEYNGKFKQSFGLKIKEWKWRSVFIGSNITELHAVDELGVKRFNWIDSSILPPLKLSDPAFLTAKKYVNDGKEFDKVISSLQKKFTLTENIKQSLKL